MISLKRVFFFFSQMRYRHSWTWFHSRQLSFQRRRYFVHRDRACRAREISCRVRQIRPDAFHFPQLEIWSSRRPLLRRNGHDHGPCISSKSRFPSVLFQFLTLRSSLRSSLFLRYPDRVFQICVKSSDLFKRYKLEIMIRADFRPPHFWSFLLTPVTLSFPFSVRDETSRPLPYTQTHAHTRIHSQSHRPPTHTEDRSTKQNFT